MNAPDVKLTHRVVEDFVKDAFRYFRGVYKVQHKVGDAAAKAKAAATTKTASTTKKATSTTKGAAPSKKVRLWVYCLFKRS